MRIVIDMQGIQNGSRYRGIGRYAYSFVKALIRNKGQNDFIILLSGLFPDSIQSIRSEFKDLKSQACIKVWEGVSPTSYLTLANDWRRKSSQFLREAFIASLEPDVLIISSMFEGAGDDSVTSIGEVSNVFTVAILYDLIPLIYEKEYLADERVLAWYSEKIDYFKKADIWFSISESSRQEGISHLNLPENKVYNISAAVESKFCKLHLSIDQKVKINTKFGITRQFIMYAGATDPRKNVKRLISAYAAVPAPIRALHQLVLAGGMPVDHFHLLKHHTNFVGLRPDEVIFTGRVTDEDLVYLYNLCKIFILPSFHEGFGLPALEAMTCGAATIGSNVSSIPEVIGMQSALFDPWSVQDITKKITQALSDEDFSKTLINHSFEQAKAFSWDKTAKLAINTLESLDNKGEIKSKARSFDSASTVSTLISKIAKLKSLDISELDLVTCAMSIARIIPREDSRPRLFIDISELHRRDLGTGIQRVVKNISKILLDSFLGSHKVELVYATENEPYRHAANFSSKLLGENNNKLFIDEIIDPRDGDIFLGLDFHDIIVSYHVDYYKFMRQRGVLIYFVVYDLLPITLAHYFSDEVVINYKKWLSIVTDQDGVICISRTVASQLTNWVSSKVVDKKCPPLQISWFHLGADTQNFIPASYWPEHINNILNELTNCPIFVTVGTIEPRKRHDQIIAAFEMLWKSGHQIKLVIIGRRGWMVDKLINYLSNHPENSKRLFWLEGISDDYLEKVYSISSCLIACSEGEGFGLPLIEAAQHKLPILARDIPIFREIAGEYAYYFTGSEPSDLADAIHDWLDLYNNDRHPKSDSMPWITWAQCTETLLKKLNSIW